MIGDDCTSINGAKVRPLGLKYRLCWVVVVDNPPRADTCTRFLFDSSMTDILREGCRFALQG